MPTSLKHPVSTTVKDVDAALTESRLYGKMILYVLGWTLCFVGA